jgi:hypothetical protein
METRDVPDVLNPWTDVDIAGTLKRHPDASQAVVDAIKDFQMKNVDGSSTEFRHDRAILASRPFTDRLSRPCTE